MLYLSKSLFYFESFKRKIVDPHIYGMIEGLKQI